METGVKTQARLQISDHHKTHGDDDLWLVTQLLIMPTVCLWCEQQAQQQQFSVSKHPGIGRDALFIRVPSVTNPDHSCFKTVHTLVSMQIQTTHFSS